MFGAFETAADEGAESLTEEGIPQDWADAITEIAQKNITPPEVHINGYVDIETFVPNGVEVIIDALKAAGLNDVKVIIGGAPVSESAKEVTGADEWAYSPQKTVQVCKEWSKL